MTINEFKSKGDKSIEVFREKLNTLRTGRANTSLVDGLQVEAYGDKMPLNQVANVSVIDAKTIGISVWDSNNVESVVEAINKSDLGLNPSVDGTLVRLNIPPMTEERRAEIAKVVGKYEEEAKISVRNARQRFLSDLKKRKEDEKLPENTVKQEESDLDKEVKSINAKIEEVAEAKRKDIMTV